MRSRKVKIVTWLILVGALVLRVYKLDWGNGYFFHPDENNMAWGINRLGAGNWNPHFFAYGQFPLYLGYLTIRLLGWDNGMAQAVMVLRGWSVVWSVLTVWGIMKLTQSLTENSRLSLVAGLLACFVPGLIQMAHFGTTESLLTLVMVMSAWAGVEIYKGHNRAFWWGAIIVGVGLAAKISAVVAIMPIWLGSVAVFIDKKIAWQKLIVFNIVGGVVALILFVLLSPYNLIAWGDFWRTIRYEVEVASGKIPVFYTQQFADTAKYWFQIQKIWPYVVGIPMFVGMITGGIILAKQRRNLSMWLVALVPSLLYWFYFGQTFCKWTRFLTPIIWWAPVLSTLLVARFDKYWQRGLVILAMVVPGVWFWTNLYFLPDVRVEATNWMVENIPLGSAILAESGNVVDLPLKGDFRVTNINFFDLDRNPQIASDLRLALSEADFVIVPSRRVFMNYGRPEFPLVEKYYDQLEEDFILIKAFERRTDLLLDPEKAEETWTVFDQPKIRIYQRI